MKAIAINRSWSGHSRKTVSQDFLDGWFHNMIANHNLEQTQALCCEHVRLTHPDERLMLVVSAYVALMQKLLVCSDFDQGMQLNADLDEAAVVDECVKAARAIPGQVSVTCAERFVRSIKEECLNHLILFGEKSLRRSINECILHYHIE